MSDYYDVTNDEPVTYPPGRALSEAFTLGRREGRAQAFREAAKEARERGLYYERLVGQGFGTMNGDAMLSLAKVFDGMAEEAERE